MHWGQQAGAWYKTLAVLNFRALTAHRVHQHFHYLKAQIAFFHRRLATKQSEYTKRTRQAVPSFNSLSVGLGENLHSILFSSHLGVRKQEPGARKQAGKSLHVSKRTDLVETPQETPVLFCWWFFVCFNKHTTWECFPKFQFSTGK